MKTRNIFCDFEQKETPHSITLNPNGNGELIFTCLSQIPSEDGKTKTPCGHFLKFAANATKEEVEHHLDVYAEHNVGKVTAADLAKLAEERAAEFADGETEDEPEKEVAPAE